MVLVPHFLRFGCQLDPNLAPNLAQNRPNIDPRAIQNPSQLASCFRSPFGWNLDWFVVGFRPSNPPKINKKSTKKSTQQPNSQNSKKYTKHIGFLYFLLLRPCHVTLKIQWKSSQHRSEKSSQINTPTWLDFGANLAPFWEGFGVQDGAKLDQIGPKIDLQINQKNDHLSDRSWDRF